MVGMLIFMASALAVDLTLACSPSVIVGGTINCDLAFTQPTGLMVIEGTLDIPAQFGTTITFSNLPTAGFSGTYVSSSKKFSIDDLNTVTGASGVTKVGTLSFTAASSGEKVKVTATITSIADQALASVTLGKSMVVSNEVTISAKAPTCVDSDGGNNLKVFGMVTTADGSISDECIISNGYLNEGFCYNDVYASKPTNCLTLGEGYTCNKGVCAKGLPSSESICSDGLDDDGDGKTDCADSDCQGYGCALGKSCNIGQCIDISAPPTCTDSDDGSNIQVQGTVTTSDGSFLDECIDNTMLTEGFCLDGTYAFAKKNCLTLGTGYACNEGKCILGKPSSENVCSDGLDDDGDGKADCADPDCQGHQCAGGGFCNAGECMVKIDNGVESFTVDAGTLEKQTLLQNIINALDSSKSVPQKISAIAKALRDYLKK